MCAIEASFTIHVASHTDQPRSRAGPHPPTHHHTYAPMTIVLCNDHPLMLLAAGPSRLLAKSLAGEPSLRTCGDLFVIADLADHVTAQCRLVCNSEFVTDPGISRIRVRSFDKPAVCLTIARGLGKTEVVKGRSRLNLSELF